MNDTWPLDERLEVMRVFIRHCDEDGLLDAMTDGYIAALFAVSPSVVKAERELLKERA